MFSAGAPIIMLSPVLSVSIAKPNSVLAVPLIVAFNSQPGPDLTLISALVAGAVVNVIVVPDTVTSSCCICTTPSTVTILASAFAVVVNAVVVLSPVNESVVVNVSVSVALLNT